MGRQGAGLLTGVLAQLPAAQPPFCQPLLLKHEIIWSKAGLEAVGALPQYIPGLWDSIADQIRALVKFAILIWLTIVGIFFSVPYGGSIHTYIIGI